MKEISYDYIRGLIDGEGCFTFSTSGKLKLPAFSLQMSVQDYDLVVRVRDKLKLKNRVYKYKPRKSIDGYNRIGMSILIIRDLAQLKNVIIPLCYKKLLGYKKIQFENWIFEIGSRSEVCESFKLLNFLYNSGYYDRIHDFYI